MPVIETTTFRLAAGVTEEAFLGVDERVRTGFLYHQPGIVRATTARGAGGDWIVILLFESDEDADSAAAGAGGDPAFGELMAMVDPTTIEQRRYTTFD